MPMMPSASIAKKRNSSPLAQGKMKNWRNCLDICSSKLFQTTLSRVSPLSPPPKKNGSGPADKIIMLDGSDKYFIYQTTCNMQTKSKEGL